MKNLAFLIFALFIAQFSQAKTFETVNVRGEFIVVDGDLEESALHLRNEYGAVKDILIKKSGKFSFEVEKNRNYVLIFSKEGYVNKEIRIDTHVEGDLLFNDVKFAVKLFPQVSDSSEVFYNQPVGMIRFIDGTEFVVEYNYSAGMVPTRVEL